jgi:glycosyltransferase involved in cell wall biosynthesis
VTLRVLHLNFHRGWGGQPSRILIGSRELARRGHEVAIAAPGDGELAARSRAAGLTVFGDFRFFKPKRVFSFVHDVRALRRVIRSWKPAILHSHGSQDTWTTVVANRLGGPRLPHVLTRHNSKRVACNAANRYLYGRALDMLVVVSGGVLERYEEFFRRGILDPAAIPVIPSSIDFPRFDAPLDREAARRGIGAGPGIPLIGSFGRLVSDKGHDVLIRAFAEVRSARPDAMLAIAGTGREEPALRTLADGLGLSRCVRFLGFRNDLPELTAAIDVSVLASVDCDASPAVVKEAMYMRRPVVVTDIGGLREMVEDGVTGLVVPPRDPGALARGILRALTDEQGARAMGERGREIVRTRYSVAALADAYERAYATLLGTAKRGLAAASR